MPHFKDTFRLPSTTPSRACTSVAYWAAPLDAEAWFRPMSLMPVPVRHRPEAVAALRQSISRRQDCVPPCCDGRCDRHGF
jgi:hypothetical protein